MTNEKFWTMRLLFGLVSLLMTFSAVAGGVTVGVSNVTSRQRYPWNGLVDIDCEVSCSDPNANLALSVSATDNVAGRTLQTHHVWLEGDSTHTNSLTVKAGNHRLVWDADADVPKIVSSNVTIEVRAIVGMSTYLVVDLSGGANATSYPVSSLDAVPQGGWSDEYKTKKLVLRLIQPGTFTMGSPENEVGRGETENQHAVTLTRPFYMGVFQVTQKQYQLVVGENKSYYRGDMRPVDEISWNAVRGDSSVYNWPNVKSVDPLTFIGKLRTKTGLNAFDLPTEAQWEYACRAGTTTALNNGKDLTNKSSDPAMDEVGCYKYNYTANMGGYKDGTKNVGMYKANAWGLYDMHGNIWEWCLDWGALNLTVAETDPEGPPSGKGRTLRGGAYFNAASACRSAYRSGNGVDPRRGASYTYGFRLCCTMGR